MTRQRHPFEEMVQIIEDDIFSIEVNQAGGFSMFQRLVRAQKVYHRLREHASSGYGAIQVLRQIQRLAMVDTDPEYENPYDAAIATYLLVLDDVVSRYAQMAARLCHSANRLWWAERVARQVLSRARQNSQTIDVRTTPWEYPVSARYRVQRAVVADAYICAEMPGHYPDYPEWLRDTAPEPTTAITLGAELEELAVGSGALVARESGP